MDLGTPIFIKENPSCIKTTNISASKSRSQYNRFTLYLYVDAHHLEDHLHGGAGDDPAVLLVEPLEALLQRLDLLHVQPRRLLNEFALPHLNRA